MRITSAFRQLLGTRLAVSAAQNLIGVSGAWAAAILVSILTVRYLGAELNGALRFLGACLALLPALVAPIDQMLERFVPGSDGPNATELVFAGLIVKLGATILAALAACLLFFTSLAHLDLFADPLARPGMVFAVWLMVLEIPLTVLAQTGRTLLRIRGRYGAVTTVDPAFAWVEMGLVALVVLLWVPPTPVGLVAITAIHAAIIFMRGGVWLGLLRAAWPGLMRGLIRQRQGLQVVKRQFGAQRRRYAGPLLANGVLGFATAEGPTIVVGAMLGYAEITYFRVARRLFSAMNRLLATPLHFVFPGLVAAYNREDLTFEPRFMTSGYIFIFIASAVSLALAIAHAPILALWKLEPRVGLATMVFVMAADLVVMSGVHLQDLRARLADDLRLLPVVIAVRAALHLGLAIWLIPHWGLVGIAAAQLVATVWLVGSYAAFNRMHRTISSRAMMHLIGATALGLIPILLAAWSGITL